MKSFVLNTQGDFWGTVRGFFRGLLTAGVADLVLVPQETSSGRSVVSTLVRDPEKLVAPDPFAPLVLVSQAKVLGNLTFKDPKARIAAVCRPCEVRAAYELVKLKQVDLSRLLLIGVDCLGTLDPEVFRARLSGTRLKDLSEDWIASMRSGAASGVRSACEVCVEAVSGNVAVNIGVVGTSPDRLVVEIKPDLADEIAGALGLSEGEAGERAGVLDVLRTRREDVRNTRFSQWRQSVPDLPALMAEMAMCLKCGNCRRACPICYCKECVFDGRIFDHESSNYVRWASRKGLIEMPTDTLLFHLTRLNHMGTSCVNCGMCESACPADLPLATLFAATSERIQAIWNYVPGRSLDDPLPLSTFREEELEPR